MKSKLLVANFKMHFNANQLDDWLHAFTKQIKLKGNQEKQVVICPASVHIYKVQEFFRQRGLKIQVGAQHALAQSEGALTGETSASMLKGYANYLLVGHSEQRAYTKPSDQELTDEISTALKFNIQPILCVGEPLDQFRAGNSEQFVRDQLRNIFAKLKNEQIKKMIIAYEPIWAIGSGETPNNKQIEGIFKLISDEASSAISEKGYVFGNMLYGGSANINNIAELNKIEGIGGYLVGSASLNPSEFAQMTNWLLG